jgi:hypothetical protein
MEVYSGNVHDAPHLGDFEKAPRAVSQCSSSELACPRVLVQLVY